jgi:hypothetical protein
MYDCYVGPAVATHQPIGQKHTLAYLSVFSLAHSQSLPLSVLVKSKCSPCKSLYYRCRHFNLARIIHLKRGQGQGLEIRHMNGKP